MKLAIGTVQFGLDYGITNVMGKVNEAQASLIIKRAIKENITIFDTAIAYGNSESVLGKLTKNIDAARFISKVANILTENKNITDCVNSSLRRLNCDSLYGLLFHDEIDLLGPQGDYYFDQLQALKGNGKIAKIGASFYTLKALEKALTRYDMDIIQIPASCLDQRFESSGLLQQAKQQGIEVHARSLFLQGLLLSPQVQLPNSIKKFQPQLGLFFNKATSLGLTPLQLSLSYLIQCPSIDYGVIGCLSEKQLLGIINAYNSMEEKKVNLAELASTDEKLINPSLWSI